MKLRKGFVSNSSTSSFMIYGYELNMDEFHELIVKNHADLFKKELAIINKKIKDSDDKMSLEEAIINHELYDIDEKLRENGMPIYMIDGETDQVFLGEDTSSMDEDETKRQFKARVEKQVAKFVGKEVECDYINHDYSC